jgi:hypothetical protein
MRLRGTASRRRDILPLRIAVKAETTVASPVTRLQGDAIDKVGQRSILSASSRR